MTLFDIAINEPRTDLFLAYLDGRLTTNEELSNKLVGFYNEWKDLTKPQ